MQSFIPYQRKFHTILNANEKLISTLRLQNSTQLAFLEWEGLVLSQYNVHAYHAFDIEYEINRIHPCFISNRSVQKRELRFL